MILAIGELLADMIGNTENGSLNFNAFPGGAPFNLAVNSKRQGASVSFISRVGNDVIGRFLVEQTKKANFDNADIQIDSERNTTLAFVSLVDGERDFVAIAIAGGAAVAGCAAHMVGFAVTSFRENGVSGLISQGLGTSMLQIPNVMKKPILFLPVVISSAITGPLSTCVFKLLCNASGGGMGTSGLVGVFDLFKYTTVDFWGVFGIILLMFIERL